MNHGDDIEVIGLHQINNAVVLKNQFPHILAFRFGHCATHECLFVQQISGLDDPVNELLGIDRHITGDVRINIAQI